MKVILCLLMIYTFVQAALCPNYCSGKGVCSQSGKCDCYPGYTGGDCRDKICPYGHPYIDPSSSKEKADLTERSNLECSGQGECDRTTGLCQCRIPYEGENCERLMCPNRCSGHGICRPIKFFTWGHGNDLEIAENENDYDKWDSDVSFKCECDKEYTGYDCSERKCKIGYMTALDCEEAEPAVTTVKFTLEASNNPMKEVDTSNPQPPPTDNVPNSNHAYLGYLEYYDSFNRVWYSDAFDITNAYSYTYTLTDEVGGDKAGNDKTLVIPGWYDVLKSFPPSVIDVDQISVIYKDGTDISCKSSDGDKDKEKCTAIDLKDGEITVSITYGASQSGRQSDNINILTMDDIKEKQGITEGGFHGLKSSVENFNSKLPIQALTPTTTPTFPVVYAAKIESNGVTTDSRGVPPTECANNGICNTVSGLCECFTGFYGDACTEQLALL